MNPEDAVWWTFLVLVLGADLLLWICAMFLDVAGESRFRLFSVAALLLLPLLGMFTGWGTAVTLWFLGVWIYAIVMAMAPHPANMAG